MIGKNGGAYNKLPFTKEILQKNIQNRCEEEGENDKSVDGWL